MKKRLLMYLLFFLAVSTLNATVSNPASRPFKIQGGVGSELRIKITALSTQSTSFAMGMPFDIEEDLVQYGAMKDGRTIATWSMTSNCPFIIKVNAGKLTSVNQKSSTDTSYALLTYILKFEYNFGYYNTSGAIERNEGSFTINNENLNGVYFNPSLNSNITANADPDGWVTCDFMPSTVAETGLSGSVDGKIYFMFTQTSTDLIEANLGKIEGDVPAGDYTAVVRVLLEAKT